MENKKIIYIASDHAGFNTKKVIIKHLENFYDIRDLGTNDQQSVDYPDYAFLVAQKVIDDNCRGILICGSGVGMCVAANKVKGVIAALVYQKELANLAVEHDDANILCLSGRYVSDEENLAIVDIFLKSNFAHGRHEQRISKIKNFETKYR